MATYTNLNLPRLGNKVLEGFVKSMAPLSLFSTNYSPEAIGRTRGNVVLVPLVGALTATTMGTTYAVCGGSKSVVTLTINRHKVVHIGQTDLDALNNSESSLDSFFFQAGAALGQAVVEDVLTLVTTANFTGTINSAAASLSPTELRAAKLALDVANANPMGRFALVDAVGMDGLLSVTNFIQAHMFADNTVLREGRVHRALGFDFHQLNSSFVSAASVNAFLGTSVAIATAMRYLEPQRPDEYDVAKQFSDSATGATFGLRDFYDPATATRYVALEANYGYGTGITNGARIIKRTD